MGVIAVADREGGYSYENQGDLEAIAPAVMHALHNNMAEEALSYAYEDLQVHSEELHVSNEELQTQTEQLHESNEALHASEEHYRMLFTNMTEAFYFVEIIYDKNGKPYDYRFLEVNPAYELIMGVKKEQMLGKSLYEVYPGVNPITIEKYNEIVLSRKSAHFEIFSQVVTDKYLDVYAFSPEKGKLAVIIRDITERKQMEDVLHENEARRKVAEAIEAERQRLFSVLETLPAMICLLTHDYHYAYTNRTFREKFGEPGTRHCYECCFGLIEPCEFCEAYKILETQYFTNWTRKSSNFITISTI
jgi:PAS domain S-box-containing protein